MPGNMALEGHFHMVTFHLSQKVYGIDIMHVKEISTFKQFTPVPNTAQHVRGVFNLRGEIIPVIDLRVFLGLEQGESNSSALVILTLQQSTVALAVDAISHVIAVKTQNIKKEHPLFSSIRGQYIAGILEHEEHLYIILNIPNILSYTNQEEDMSSRVEQAMQDALVEIAPPSPTAPPPTPAPAPEQSAARISSPPAKSRIEQAAEQVAAHCAFRLNRVNQHWFNDYLLRSFSPEGNWLLQQQELAGERNLPASFLSPCRQQLWDKTLIKDLRRLLTQSSPHKEYRAWIIDCGLGHEAYSLTMVLRLSLPDIALKVLASDHRYSLISRATQLNLPLPQLPDIYRSFVCRMPESDSFGFNQELADAITFDYSDLIFKGKQGPFDLIIAREVLSRYAPAPLEQVLQLLWDSLKPEGRLLLGVHEQLASHLAEDKGPAFTVYRKKDSNSSPVAQEESCR